MAANDSSTVYPNWTLAAGKRDFKFRIIQMMKRRLLAHALGFLVLAFAGLYYLHHYEVWWLHRGRASYIAFQTSFFDQSIATLHISASLALAILFSTLCLWLGFELVSRFFLLIFEKLHSR
jgi:hypothetical protein